MHFSAAAFMSCATCGPAYPTSGKANGRRLVALTQRSNRQRKGRSAGRGRVTLSTLPWSTSAAKASRLHSRSSLENGTREHRKVSRADAIVESVFAAYKSCILQYLPIALPACKKTTCIGRCQPQAFGASAAAIITPVAHLLPLSKQLPELRNRQRPHLNMRRRLQREMIGGNLLRLRRKHNRISVV